ncbi:hypothetical protein [Burkholderia glumae]|uniref:hypothetical protein n=1 Tax=Burkholderia glumae TaxID=337 RepID=UPI003BA3AA52
MIDQHHAAPELSGHGRAHHAGGARADHGDIEMFHGADCNRRRPGCPPADGRRRAHAPGDTGNIRSMPI